SGTSSVGAADFRPEDFRIGPQPPGNKTWELYTRIFQQLESMPLDETTRIYSTPNAHLILTIYSGLSIQDITPVRKSFLDSYQGQIVYIDLGPTHDTGILAPARLQETALERGDILSDAAAEAASALLS